MAALEFFVVSEDCVVDQATNRLSIFNVLDSVNSPRFPVVIPKCVAVTLWKREDGDEERDFQSTLVITEPNGRQNRVETNFKLSTPRHRILNRIQGIPVSGPGDLTFELLLNGQHVASHTAKFEAALAIDQRANEVRH